MLRIRNDICFISLGNLCGKIAVFAFLRFSLIFSSEERRDGFFDTHTPTIAGDCKYRDPDITSS